jgi:hypothetical protein
MNYNEKFKIGYIIEFNKDLDFIHDIQSRILDFAIKVLTSVQDVEQNKNFECFIGLLGKVRTNIESINSLFHLLRKDVKFKISINLLYRCIVDDIINFVYLLLFIDTNDINQISLGNELNVFHKEFLVSIMDATKAKLIHDNEFSILTVKESEDAGESILYVIKNNPELIKENGKGAANAEIRKGTNHYFLEKLKKINGSNNLFLTEATKLSYIESSNFEHYNQLKYLFKYFSQFQHYTPESINLIHKNMDTDIYNYVNTVEEVLYVIQVSLTILNFENKEYIQNQFDELTKYIISVKQ